MKNTNPVKAPAGDADKSPMRPGPTLQPLVGRYIAEGVASGRLKRDSAIRAGYRLYRFSDSFGGRPLNQLTARAVERWMAGLGGLAAGTRRLNLANVRSFCRWLLEEGLIHGDPTKGMIIRKPRVVPRALAPDKVAALLAEMPDARARAIVLLMVHCGLRCCEAARADIGDYDPRMATILVHGKGDHERVLPVPDGARAALERWIVERGVVGGPLFPSRNNPSAWLTAGTVSGLVVRWMWKAGIKNAARDGVAAHALRHTAASDVLDATHDLRMVQEMLGHVSLTSTQIYLRRADLGRLREAMEGRDYAARGSTLAYYKPAV